MFKRLHDPQPAITIDVDGEPVIAQAGESVAAALLAHSDQVLRTSPVSAAPRAPYCMIGICFECLVEIDGVRNRQACMTLVQEGMRVRRQLDQGQRQP